MASRKLTRGELHLCRVVFKHSLETRNIDVVNRLGSFGGFTPYGRVNMDRSTYRADYIGGDLNHPTAGTSLAHHFLHELAHCWQHFVGMGMMHEFRKSRREGRKYRKAHGVKDRFDSIYGYNIGDHGDLLDFNMEQQGEIIADYFAWILWHRDNAGNPAPYATAAAVVNPGNPHWGGFPSLAQFRLVLANFLRDPSYPRDSKRINDVRAGWRGILRE